MLKCELYDVHVECTQTKARTTLALNVCMCVFVCVCECVCVCVYVCIIFCNINAYTCVCTSELKHCKTT
jgi:hypothetical protein